MEYIDKYVWYQEGPGVRKAQYTNQGIKLLNVANLVDGKIDLSTSHRYISKTEANNKYKHFLVDEGDLIIASSGIKVEYFNKKMGFVKKEHLPLCMNTSTIRFKSLNPKVTNIRYFMWFLKSETLKRQLGKLITGSAQLNFGPSHLKKIKIDMPDLKSQNKIVEKLDKVQEIIDMRKNQIQELDILLKSQFIEMFGDTINNSKKFNYREIGEISQIVTGTTPDTSNIENWNGNINWITPAEIDKKSLFINDTQRKITEKGMKSKSLSIMPVGTVLFTSRAPIGKVAISGVEMCCNQGFKNCICKSEINNIYLYSLLKYNADYLDSLGTGATFRELSKSNFSKIKISVPPLSLQNKFADLVKQIDKHKLEIQMSLEETQKLKESLMNKYFEYN